MRLRPLQLIMVVMLTGLAGCDADQTGQTEATHADPAPFKPQPGQRWYDPQMVIRGEPVYQIHCAECHQSDASGTSDWKQPTPDGKYPPPPLNGSAHAWHHPLNILRRTVRNGGVALGGTMPAFADKLTAREIDDILAWVQSHWPERIYRIWDERNQQTIKQPR